MKRIFTVLTIALMAVSFFSCKPEKTVKLNERVGEILQGGIIFYIPDDESYALVCSPEEFKERNKIHTPNWMPFVRDTLIRTKDTLWRDKESVGSKDPDKIESIDTLIFFGVTGATSMTDGAHNTNMILNHPVFHIDERRTQIASYTGKSNDPLETYTTAAYACRVYYTGYGTLTPDKTDSGQWYLPSLEELRYLYNAKDRVNAVAVDPMDKYCYWSSTEKNYESAHYKCFSNGVESYVWKKTTSEFDRLRFRPIKKVML